MVIKAFQPSCMWEVTPMPKETLSNCLTEHDNIKPVHTSQQNKNLS